MRVLPLITAATLLALLTLRPSSALAQDDNPESVRGLKIVIPESRGRRSWGRANLSRTLRRTMSAAVGPLVKSRDFTASQRKLKLRGKKRSSPEGLAKAARAIGAQFILDVSISKKKWLYTAQALLINAETGEVQMDFRSQYYKPRKEAGDRGERIARRTIQKLAELMDRGGAPAVVVATAPPPAAPPPDASPPRMDDQNDDDLRVDDDNDLDSDTAPIATAPPVDDTPPPIATAPPPAPPPPVRSSPPPPASFSGNSNSATVDITPDDEPKPEFLRLSLGAGAGLLRTYDITSAAGGNSPLSHQLAPLSLIDVRAEFIAPVVPVSLGVAGAFRPVKYGINVADQGMATPSGSVLDVSVGVGYHIGIAGAGRETYKIIPMVGARLTSSSVNEHPGNAVLSSNTFAAVGGLGIRLPFNDVLEVNLGVDGGLILSYSESPATSGDAGSGFTIGGDLGVRIWVSDAIAIAIDNRFTYDSISLSGTPSRQIPDNQEQALQDASITWKDLRTSAGIAVRL